MDGLHLFFPGSFSAALKKKKTWTPLYVHVSDFDLCCRYFHTYSQKCYCSYHLVDYYTPLNAVAVHMLWC